jgi:hypothetical protein
VTCMICFARHSFGCIDSNSPPSLEDAVVLVSWRLRGVIDLTAIGALNGCGRIVSVFLSLVRACWNEMKMGENL